MRLQSVNRSRSNVAFSETLFSLDTSSVLTLKYRDFEGGIIDLYGGNAYIFIFIVDSYSRALNSFL